MESLTSAISPLMRTPSIRLQVNSFTHATHPKGPLGPCFASGPLLEAIHPALRYAVLPSCRLDALDLLFVNPLLDRGEADTKVPKLLRAAQQASILLIQAAATFGDRGHLERTPMVSLRLGQ